eukprot:jgi/Galph1/3296/GphlegSOOS_G1986.1
MDSILTRDLGGLVLETAPASLFSYLCHHAPSVVQANFHRNNGNPSVFSSLWSIRDPLREKQRVFQRIHRQSSANQFHSTIASLEEDCVNICWSPSATRFIKFYQTSSKDARNGGVISRRVEIWNKETLEKTLLCSDKLHGSFYMDEWFGGVSWSPQEDKVLYVAEQPTIPSVSCFAEAKPEEKQGDQFVKQVDFGETYTGKKPAALFCLDLLEYKIHRVQGIDENMAVSEPQFSPNGKQLVFIGRYLESYPLGIKYCYNRPSILFLGELLYSQDQLKVQIRPLTDPNNQIDYCVRSPRFHPNNDIIVYLTTPKTPQDVHNATCMLRLIHWKDNKLKTLIDWVPHRSSIHEFPGLYSHALPLYPWLNANTLLMDSIWDSQSVILQISNIVADEMMSAQVERLDVGDNGEGNVFLLDVTCDAILYSSSTPVSSSCLFWMKLHGNHFSDRVKLSSALDLSGELGWMKPTDLRLSHERNPSDANQSDFQSVKYISVEGADEETFQAFVVYPRQTNRKIRLLCFPHGGPHSSHLIQFQLGVAYLALRGYAIVMVNYRGSLGRGQRALTSLIGKIGYQDVDECVAAIHWACDKVASVSRDAFGVIGGSHGGFLGAHLTSQYPSFFRTAVLRNPVTNIVSMHASTDIRDWCFTELGLPSQKSKPFLAVNSDILQRMWKHSPISYVQQCRAATLMLLGGSDRRVPPSQGMEWYQILTSQKVPTRLLWYPNSDHSLSESPTSEDSWVQTLLWLEEHLKEAV